MGEDLRIVIDAHTAISRILAVHQFRKRHAERVAERLNDAVIRHTLPVLPLGDGLVRHTELFC